MRPVTAREQDQPLCPEGDFRFWASVGATATAAWVLGCLAGLAPLVGHPAGSPSLIERLSAAAAAAVWVALCTGAGSLGFATPLGYQTHMMVYGPGGYRFVDFLRIGIPMDILCFAIAMATIPLVFPLR